MRWRSAEYRRQSLPFVAELNGLEQLDPTLLVYGRPDGAHGGGLARVERHPSKQAPPNGYVPVEHQPKCYSKCMKGVSYLVDEEGKKTHAVLDLGVWQATLEALLADDAHPRATPKERKPGFLTELLTQAGYTQEQLDEMNKHSAEEALKPLTDEELGLNNAL